MPISLVSPSPRPLIVPVSRGAGLSEENSTSLLSSVRPTMLTGAWPLSPPGWPAGASCSGAGAGTASSPAGAPCSPAGVPSPAQAAAVGRSSAAPVRSMARRAFNGLCIRFIPLRRFWRERGRDPSVCFYSDSHGVRLTNAYRCDADAVSVEPGSDMDNRWADLPEVLRSALDKAIGLQQSLVAGYVARLRRARPGATPAEIIAVLEKQYLRAATGTGTAVGGVAAAPGVGTAVALTLSGGGVGGFFFGP